MTALNKETNLTPETTASRVIKGITWDHPRAVDSIRRVSQDFTALNPETTFEWTARPLHEFEDVSLEQLAADFDVIAFDHPFIGSAVSTGVLAPLDELVDALELRERSHQYVGHSFHTYVWNGSVWALPVDAACMVSASRDSLFSTQEPPTTWGDALTLMRRLGKRRTLLAANPTHLWGTYLSLCHAFGTEATGSANIKNTWWNEGGISNEIALPSLDLLRDLLSLVEPRSLHMDPVAVLDELSGRGPSEYTPLVFGYSTYGLDSTRTNRVRFHDAPSLGQEPVGTLTGGVGLGVSADSANKESVAEFVLFATSADVQSTSYTEAGGQPAHLAAWQSTDADNRLHGFFSNTVRTMERSFVRPRGATYPSFQKKGAALLHESIVNSTPSEQVIVSLNSLWRANDEC